MHLQTKIARYWKRRLMVQVSPRPLISFTFDDFPRSAATVAGEILAEHGVRGTYYASMGLMGGRTALGEIFHREDLQSLLAAGHELGCHTLNHTRSCDATPTELLNSCRENRVRMAEELRGYEPRSFAFPEGVVTMAGKAALGSTYESCRTIEPGLNCDPVDLAYLRANRVYSRWGISGLKQAIRSNLERNGWMILYTHDVAENPSGYGCTPVEFREILRFAVESGADVLTVGEAAKRYAAVATRRD